MAADSIYRNDEITSLSPYVYSRFKNLAGVVVFLGLNAAYGTLAYRPTPTVSYIYSVTVHVHVQLQMYALGLLLHWTRDL